MGKSNRNPPEAAKPTTDLMEWAAAFTVPHSSDGTPRKVRFRPATLPAPEAVHTDAVRVRPAGRRPNGEAVLIDVAEIVAEHEGYRALGLVLLSYAISEQKEPLCIHLPAAPETQVRQIVLWPDTPTLFELELGIQLRVQEVRYRPRARKLIEFDGAGNRIHEEEEDESRYPREHLPFCTLGPPGAVRFGPPVRPQDPWCLHLAGTGPGLVWLGKLFLDLSLSDSNCGHTYRYNTLPAEELAHGSAELSLFIGAPEVGPW